MFNINSLNEDEKFALLFGILAGDGCLSLVKGRLKFISIVGGLDDLPFFEEIVSPLLKYFRGKATNIKFRKDCNAIEFNFSDVNLFNLFVLRDFPVGKKGLKLVIPKFFYEKDLLKHVIAGFFATDGSLVLTKNPNKYYPRIEGNGISKGLILQISNHLNEVGLSGKFYRAKRINDLRDFKVLQDQYRFQFNGKKNSIAFREKIGFVNPKHEEKFLNFLRYSEEYDLNIKGISNSKHYLIRNKVRL